MTAEKDPGTVQNIDAKGNAPKRRIATPMAAQSAYHQARDLERRRDLRFNAIMGIFSGFPPTDPAEMDLQGMGDMPNCNNKQFQAKIDGYVSNWNAINAAGSEWFEVRAQHDDPMEAERRSKYLTKCFNRAIKQWDGTEFCHGRHYVINSAARDLQMGLFGIGVAHFCDSIDFRWRVRPTRKVLVPEGTNLLLDNCPALFIEDDMSVTDFWAMRKKPGWNEEAVTEVLYNHTRSAQNTGRTETLAEWTERIRENDAWTYSDFPLVKFVHCYTKEFGDNANKADITHTIFSDSVYPSNTTDPKDAKDRKQSWIYEKLKVATRWSQVVSVFSDNAGPECKWHGVKGFGDLIFDACHLGNQLFNATAVASIVNNMLLFEGGNESDRQKLSQVKITRFGILAPGLKLEQVRINSDINAALAMFDLNTNILNANSRQFPQNDQKQSGEAPTATQVNFDRADEARFTNLQVSFYRATGLDSIGSEQYRRIAQPAGKYPESWPGGDVAKEFRERCAEYGIPEEDLLKVEYVRANRQVGTGNMGLDVMRSDQALSVATPGQGQLNARKLKVEALYGSDMVPALIEEKLPPPNYEDVQIDNENLAIQGGQQPQAFGFQPHEKHLGVGMPNGHITLLAEIETTMAQVMEQEGAIEQNVDAAEKLHKALVAGIEHAGQHVAFMAELMGSRGRNGLFQEQVKELNKVLNDLTQFAETFGESLEKAQQAQNPQQGMTPEQMKAQADIEIKKALAENDIMIQQAKARSKIENDQIKTAAKTENTVAAHELKLGLTAEQRAFDNEANRTRTEQELSKQQASAAIDLGKQAALGAQQIEQAQQKAAATNGTSE